METASAIQKKLIQAIAILTIAFIFSLTTYFIPGFAASVNETHASWFQRSGSFMVVASLWAEFIVIRTEGYLDPYNEKYIVVTDMPAYLNKIHLYLSRAAVVFALYGTIVWGYGDLFIKNT